MFYDRDATATQLGSDLDRPHRHDNDRRNANRDKLLPDDIHHPGNAVGTLRVYNSVPVYRTRNRLLRENSGIAG